MNDDFSELKEDEEWENVVFKLRVERWKQFSITTVSEDRFPKIKLGLLFIKAENKSVIMFYWPKSCGFFRKSQDLWQTIEENLVRRSNNLNSKLARIRSRLLPEFNDAVNWIRSSVADPHLLFTQFKVVFSYFWLVKFNWVDDIVKILIYYFIVFNEFLFLAGAFW